VQGSDNSVSEKIALPLKVRNMRKVCFIHGEVLEGYELMGGHIGHMAGLIEGLRLHGWSTFFLSPCNIPVVDEMAKIFAVKFNRNFKHPVLDRIFYNLKLVIKGLSILRRERPALLYERHSNSNLAGVILAKLLKIPIVMELNSPLGTIKNRDNFGAYYELALLGEKIALRNSTLVTVVSEVAEELVRSTYPFLRVVVNPNGVNPKAFSPDVSGAEVRKAYGLQRKKILGFSGHFMWWHGVTILLKAMVQILQKHQDVHLMLIGDSEYKKEYENLARELGIIEKVTFTGRVPFSEVPRHLAACDILVSPHVPVAAGIPFHGSPLKIFEYMAMGKPIVASDLGQMGEILTHEKAALLVTPGDSNELANAVSQLIDNVKLAARLGRNARQEAMKYTWEVNARRLLTAVNKQRGYPGSH
jgi:glycosyltransferase involved in cell wall biosynthesis